MSQSVQYLPMETFEQIKTLFAERVERYRITFTSHSIQFQPEDHTRDKLILTDRVLSYKALGLMGSLKKEVRQRLPNIKIDYGDTHYYQFNQQIANGRCSEYDLEHAYLSALFELGGISDALYQKLSQVKKGERLAVVGSLATNKLILEYHYSEQLSTMRQRDRALFAVWKTITYHVDLKMRKWFMNDQTGLFYWVDALFTKSETKLPGTRERKVSLGTFGNQIYTNDGRRFPILQQRPHVETTVQA